MAKSFTLGAALALSTLASSVPVPAADRWEGGTYGDDSNSSRNTLAPGVAQEHDLDQEGTANEDFDWAVVPTLQYHSYEARISGTDIRFDWGGCDICAQFERVDEFGTILTEDVSTVNEGGSEVYDRSLRWMATGNVSREFVRIRGGNDQTENPTFAYTLRHWDTTYTVPRWNASGTQTTIFVITSVIQAPVAGTIYFFSGTGALLHSAAVTLQPRVPLVLNTAAIGPLAGQSGFALIAHTGGYGALTGKAVALEPSTGFTFDTVMAPIPQ